MPPVLGLPLEFTFGKLIHLRLNKNKTTQKTLNKIYAAYI